MSILPQALWTITWVLGPRLKRLLILHFREVTLWREKSIVERSTPAKAALCPQEPHLLMATQPLWRDP